MAIFNKLTGLAQRAKDGAMTKVVLAKDKRLEQSFSETLDLDKIRLGKMSTYGLPETISTVAYDPVASLLAVAGGSTQYSIRVFGKGMSARLQLQTVAPVKYLQFKIGSPVLIVIDRDNRISLVDLKTRQASHVLEGDGIITCFEYCVGTDWLYLGYADGYVNVLDLKTASFSPYRVPDLWQQQMPPANHDRFCSIVTAIQIHPTDLDLLLIGYPSAVFLWSIREKAVKKTFRLQTPARLTCLNWCPEGERWVGGYDDGCIHMWDVRSDIPIFSRKVFQAPSPTSDCEPIYSLAWYIDDSLQKSFVIVAGGSEIPGLFGLHVLEIDTHTRECRKQTIVPSPVDISSFVLMPRDPYYLGGRQPLGVLVLGCDGTLRAHSLAHGYPLLTLPPALGFIDPPVTHALPVLLKPAAFELLRPPPIPTQYLPLAGGVVGPDHTYRISSNDVLITLHPDSTISFYDASYTALRPLPHLTRDCRHDLQDPVANISAVNLDPESATLSVGFDTGSVLIYHIVEAALPKDDIVANCDSTLKEISDLLQDMDMLPDEQIPFEPLESPEFSVEITKFEFSSPNITKYLPAALIKLPLSIKHIASAGKDIIALATTDGKVALVDTKSSRVLFSSDMRK
ncbi:WD40-repeat-containing domain protein [Phycomyces nitens]|nr:WD40-repeat-containing domain protein [Phycomyces nitens]